MTVEWVGGGEAVETFSGVVVPEISIAIDVREDEVRFTHAGGEPVDAGRLAVAFRPHHGEDATTAWGEPGDRVEEGDSITVDRPEAARGVTVTYEGRQIAGERFGD